MTVYKWSQVAAADASADPSINWQEGQAPSSVNDSARSMMAAVAKYRDDITGAIVSGGTSIAYTVSTFQAFDSFSRLDKQMVAFTPHVTNTALGVAGVTLNVDGLGAKPLATAPGAPLLPGVLVQGTPYVAVYNNADGAFYLQGFFGNPYNIPLGAGLDYWGQTAPNSAFAFPIGQGISRTTFSALFSVIGTIYGAGDGSTTFNLPDKRGRVSAALDPTGTILASFAISPNGNSLGGKGGAQGINLSTINLPPYTPSGTVSVSVVSTTANVQVNSGTILSITNPGGPSAFPALNNSAIASTGSGVFAGNPQGGANSPILTTQPTILCNYVMRII